MLRVAYEAVNNHHEDVIFRSQFQHWSELCHTVETTKWKKVDTHDGVTVARSKFGRGSRGHAVIKIEGVLTADPATVYQFLQLSTREGGKVGKGEGSHDIGDCVFLPAVGLHLQE